MDRFNDFMFGCVWIVLLCLFGQVNCIQKDAVRMIPETEVQAMVEAAVKAEVDTVVAGMSDSSKRVAEPHTAVQGHNNDTQIETRIGDELVGRIMATGLVVVAGLLVLSYPLGKFVWLLGARCLFPTRTRKKKKSEISENFA